MSELGYRLLSAGDQAVTVELSRRIDPAVIALVQRLDACLTAAAPLGLVEIVPTYRSLQIVFDPLLLPFDDVAALVERAYRVAALHEEWHSSGRIRRLLVPVLYGGACGIDLDAAAEDLGLSPATLIEIHATSTMTVAMIGFQPGFAYLSGLPEQLHLSRHETPRLVTPPGSVSMGGIQAAISSVAAPSACHLLGRTPLRGFDLARPEPFLFRPGDRIDFHPIDEAEFHRLDELIRLGKAPDCLEERDAET